jgi:ABC-type transport system involved in multi-copper enzyme maturation permease subunit
MNAAVVGETLRRHFMSVAYLAFVVLIALAGLLSSTFNRPASMWPTLVTILAIITGSALIGPEFSVGTLQLIVTKPVRRPVYLLSRAAGVFTAVTIAAVVALGAEALGRMLLRPDAVPWDRIIGAFGGALVESLLSISLLTLLGSLTRAYLNAAIYIGTQVVLGITASLLGVTRVRRSAFGAFLEANPVIERGLARFDDFLFPSAPMALEWMWIARVVATAAIALTLACLAFTRREVPYGAD